MSLSIGLGRLAGGLSLPRLPEIKIRIPNPFASPSSSSSPSNTSSNTPSNTQASSSEASQSLRQRLEEYLADRDVEESFFIDNGLLRAVPKRKPTPQKSKQKRNAPGSKQLKFLHHLNRCPSCGHYKRAHTLCMHCVSQIQRVWRRDLHAKEESNIIEQELDEVDRRILYPGKVESEYSKMLKKRKEYVDSRSRTLPVVNRSKDPKK